eukprot:1548844-Pleurochrysis_carterae.AAC.3
MTGTETLTHLLHIRAREATEVLRACDSERREKEREKGREKGSGRVRASPAQPASCNFHPRSGRTWTHTHIGTCQRYKHGTTCCLVDTRPVAASMQGISHVCRSMPVLSCARRVKAVSAKAETLGSAVPRPDTEL